MSTLFLRAATLSVQYHRMDGCQSGDLCVPVSWILLCEKKLLYFFLFHSYCSFLLFFFKVRCIGLGLRFLVTCAGLCISSCTTLLRFRKTVAVLFFFLTTQTWSPFKTQQQFTHIRTQQHQTNKSTGSFLLCLCLRSSKRAHSCFFAAFPLDTYVNAHSHPSLGFFMC